ncbi:MAG: PA0069 family radical SAM protein [Myxococcales bacterium]|nr:MAG: PA0069 family radical SAM protein [Myxococcales bacterium]
MRPVEVNNPPNPWQRSTTEYLGEPPGLKLQVYEDHTREILSRNDSPDIPFRYSVNPYRGCYHACSYCYARPTHEYLGFGAGTDFDRRIVVKPEAARLLREAFERPSWAGEVVVFSGNTDCYQPLEASYRLTRGCLEVCADYRNPVGIITKGALIERDLDVLTRLHRDARVSIAVSLPFLNEERARTMEPHAPTPARRLQTIERLTAAGLRVSVMMAPVIPGLNDEEIGDVLRAARTAGAVRAGMTLLRLPGSAEQVFTERLQAEMPLRAERVLARSREVRGGVLNDNRPGHRHGGQGPYAHLIESLFATTARKLGLAGDDADDTFAGRASTFRRPTDRGGQMRLFDGD